MKEKAKWSRPNETWKAWQGWVFFIYTFWKWNHSVGNFKYFRRSFYVKAHNMELSTGNREKENFSFNFFFIFRFPCTYRMEIWVQTWEFFLWNCVAEVGSFIATTFVVWCFRLIRYVQKMFSNKNPMNSLPFSKLLFILPQKCKEKKVSFILCLSYTCSFVKSFFMMWQEFSVASYRRKQKVFLFGIVNVRWWLSGFGLRNLNVMYISERFMYPCPSIRFVKFALR